MTKPSHKHKHDRSTRQRTIIFRRSLILTDDGHCVAGESNDVAPFGLSLSDNESAAQDPEKGKRKVHTLQYLNGSQESRRGLYIIRTVKKY